MAKIKLELTLDIDTKDAGIDIDPNQTGDPTEDEACDAVYEYFAERADELADLIKQKIDEKKDYQDLVHDVVFESWD